MATFQAVQLPEDLKNTIRQLSADLGLPVEASPGQEAPCPGSSQPLRLAPAVWTRSDFFPFSQNERGELRMKDVNDESSPWDDRWKPEFEGNKRAMDQKLWEEHTNREYWQADRLRERTSLPIYSVCSQLVETVRKNSVTLVAADTGSGKSTQVPQFLLDDAIKHNEGSSCHVVCTQPRRLAAVSLAARVAWERGEEESHDKKWGCASVGHVVRWDESPPRPWGSIVYCTVGALLPRLCRLGASHIVVDEAHTRDIHTDLLMTVLLELLRSSPNLRVLVMSATFDTSRWLRHFGKFSCAVVQASGRPHHVKPYFLEDIVEELRWQAPAGSERTDVQGVWSEVDYNRGFTDASSHYSQATADVVRGMPENLIPFRLIASILAWLDNWDRPGGVLIFLPGWHEIAACASHLQKDHRLRSFDFVRLHSTVPPAEQQRAFWPASYGRRKAVLSTDLAETSVTIPDILLVIDSGLARVKMQTFLEVVWASQANLLQRRGRAGRVQQGACVHLYTKKRFDSLDAEPTPEMKRVPLDETVLSVCDLGLDNSKPPDQEEWETLGACAYVVNFLRRAPDPPADKDIWKAFCELQHVGALDDNGYLTHLGALLVRLPLAPSLGVAFFLAGLLGAPSAASHVAGSLDTREPWARKGRETEGSQAVAHELAKGEDGKMYWSDAFILAKALTEFEQLSLNRQKYFCGEKGLILPVMQQLSSARQQLRNTLRDLGCSDPDSRWSSGSTGDSSQQSSLEDSWPIMQTMLCWAFGWNLGSFEGGRRVEAGWHKAARLAKNSVLVDGTPDSPLLVYAELASGGGRILRGATMVTPQQLLFCGGRRGQFWEAGAVQLEGWFRIKADFESAALLAALRSATKKVLQKAAETAYGKLVQGPCQGDHAESHRPEQRVWWQDIQKRWRDCVREVVCAPLPERVCPWDVATWESPRRFTPAVLGTTGETCQQSILVPSGASTALSVAGFSQAPPPEPDEELPIGWAQHREQTSGRIFFEECCLTSSVRWIKPRLFGRDGKAADWRWRKQDGELLYLRKNTYTGELEEHRAAPDVGDGHILPEGFEARWVPESRRYIYVETDPTGWHQPQPTWICPEGPLEIHEV